jgi:hypothetical protein
MHGRAVTAAHWHEMLLARSPIHPFVLVKCKNGTDKEVGHLVTYICFKRMRNGSKSVDVGYSCNAVAPLS